MEWNFRLGLQKRCDRKSSSRFAYENRNVRFEIQLLDYAVDYAQGYLFSEPVPLHEFEKLLDQAQDRRQQHEGVTYSAHERSSPDHMPPFVMPGDTRPKRRRKRPDVSRHNS